ncbi:flagellar hook-basal body complex protein FliE [Serratia fonticola]|uniref:flagellar hook-basal body complex protein FliE n=1 Tax=Serratia fonticola TaxID=47917 RepID=UPI000418D015|nr:flagellar hook-basal body complex protein FliE [Serratia fonticola]
MSIQVMNNVLEQMQLQASQIKETKQVYNQAEKPQPLNFTDMLLQSISNISDLQIETQQQSQKYMTGVPGIGLNDVMVSLQKSSIALNLGTQVRNKLVNAYQEIMNMSV